MACFNPFGYTLRRTIFSVIGTISVLATPVTIAGSTNTASLLQGDLISWGGGRYSVTYVEANYCAVSPFTYLEPRQPRPEPAPRCFKTSAVKERASLAAIRPTAVSGMATGRAKRLAA